MTETGSSGQFKAVQDLMHEMVAMWQRVKDMEEADRDNRVEIDALRVTDARLRCVIEKLPLRFFFKDSGLNYVLCSEAYAHDWDMKPGELSGKSDRDLFSADVVEKLAAVEYEMIHTGKMEIAEEDRLVTGREITVLAIRKPIINGTGDTLGLLCVLWDITEDKRLKVNQERRIHELEGALSERVGEVESLKSELEKSSAEHQQKEGEFSRLRVELESGIAALKEDIRITTADFGQREEELKRLRTELETEVQARREEIHRLRNELQKEMFERGQALEALKKSVAHSQELLESVQNIAGAQ
jgi:Skp family chaperone for outer membrane proteins